MNKPPMWWQIVMSLDVMWCRRSWKPKSESKCGKNEIMRKGRSTRLSRAGTCHVRVTCCPAACRTARSKWLHSSTLPHLPFKICPHCTLWRVVCFSSLHTQPTTPTPWSAHPGDTVVLSGWIHFVPALTVTNQTILTDCAVLYNTRLLIQV